MAEAAESKKCDYKREAGATQCDKSSEMEALQCDRTEWCKR